MTQINETTQGVLDQISEGFDQNGAYNLRQNGVSDVYKRQFWYCVKEGMKNICRNIWFSLASVATISACIFLFCLFFSIIANIRYMVKHVESTVGITVLFDENLTEQDIQGLGEIIHQRPEIREMYYISAEDAWNSFKEEYFAGHEELAEGFAEDNPLAGSASYEIFLNDISQPDELVSCV